ncbi:MAG: hypothetical protein ABW072_18695 [Sedimenticola sp.]
MANFDLSKYKKTSDSNGTEIPEWVSEGTPATAALYQAVKSEVITIERRIRENKKGDLAQRKRQIVNKSIAEIAGVDASNLSPRRQPDIIHLIHSENDRLEALWIKLHGRKSSGNKPKRDELVIKNKELKDKIGKLKAKKIRETFESLLESEILETHASLAKKNRSLIQQNADLREEVANLQSQIRKLTLKSVD